jgi:hypothetical protein
MFQRCESRHCSISSMGDSIMFVQYSSNTNLLLFNHDSSTPYITRNVTLSCVHSFYYDCSLASRRNDPVLYVGCSTVFCWLNVPVTPIINGWQRRSRCPPSPPPKMDEFGTNDDSDPRAAYCRQMENCLDVRMAILALVLGKERVVSMMWVR